MVLRRLAVRLAQRAVLVPRRARQVQQALAAVRRARPVLSEVAAVRPLLDSRRDFFVR